MFRLGVILAHRALDRVRIGVECVNHGGTTNGKRVFLVQVCNADRVRFFRAKPGEHAFMNFCRGLLIFIDELPAPDLDLDAICFDGQFATMAGEQIPKLRW